MNESGKQLSWREVEARRRAQAIIDPRGLFAELFAAFSDSPDAVDEHNRSAVLAGTFAEEPGYAAAIRQVMATHEAAVAAVAKLLSAKVELDMAVQALRRDASTSRQG